MYRVNAERSQEKNDRSGGMQRCTKVTCATRTRKNSPISQLHLLFLHPVVSATRVCFKRTLRCDAGVIARRESWRSFSRSTMRDDFAALRCLKERLQRATREGDHGGFE